jgi:hypothetical protein
MNHSLPLSNLDRLDRKPAMSQTLAYQYGGVVEGMADQILPLPHKRLPGLFPMPPPFVPPFVGQMKHSMRPFLKAQK